MFNAQQFDVAIGKYLIKETLFIIISHAQRSYRLVRTIIGISVGIILAFHIWLVFISLWWFNTKPRCGQGPITRELLNKKTSCGFPNIWRQGYLEGRPIIVRVPLALPWTGFATESTTIDSSRNINLNQCLDVWLIDLQSLFWDSLPL